MTSPPRSRAVFGTSWLVRQRRWRRLQIVVRSTPMLLKTTSTPSCFARRKFSTPRIFPAASHCERCWTPRVRRASGRALQGGALAWGVDGVRLGALGQTCGGPHIVECRVADPDAPEAAGASIIHWKSESTLCYDTVTADELANYPGVDWCATSDDAYSRTAALHAAHYG